ncbi:MAG: YbfB/YjiJ family MFS transporter [Acidisphaera sp.]|nr:YbfB/YjiJ family MFS transporter [Acidisphaera sp.]
MSLPTAGLWRPALAGCLATFLGVGLQRFAYSPLLPAMIQDGWVSPGAGGVLGAANLGAYLFGALYGPAAGRRFGLRRTLRGAMLLAAACFALCAIRGSLVWLLPWRFLAGVAGGALMVLAGPAVQQAVPVGRRGLAGGLLFAGVGLGVVAGAAIVPGLLPWGVSAAWLGLCAAGLLSAAAAWRLWPDVPPPPPRGGRLFGRAVPGAGLLMIAYALAAVAAAPHMLWWADFIARGLGRGTNAGAASWLIWGVAGALGPAVCGRLADRIGAWRALLAAFLVQEAALAIPLLSAAPWLLSLSAAAAGGTAIGVTALTLTRIRELAGEGTPRLWALGTAAYGAAQTLAGFGMAGLYAATDSHLPLFGLGLLGGALALPLLPPRGGQAP